MARAPEDVFTPEMEEDVAAKSVLILTADGVEDLEFFYPYYRFIEEGFNVDVATPRGGEFKGKNGYGLPSTWKLSDVNAVDYDLLFIPGGKAPAELKKNEEALALVRLYAQGGNPVAAICHGPQVLAAAGLVRDRSVSGWPEIQDELEAAGARYVNEKTVVDGRFITARWPADLPAFSKRMLAVLENAVPEARADSAHTHHLTV